MMKKNTIIVMLTIALLLSLPYGIYQKIRADKNEEKLSETLLMNEERLELMQEVADEAHRKIEIMAIEAMKLKKTADQHIKKLKK